MKENCNEKHKYRTQAEAEATRRRIKKDMRRSGGGHGIRKLNAYYCEAHKCWHLGRSAFYQAQKLAAPKIPSTGQLRRKAARLLAKMDGDRQHLHHLLGEIIRRDAQRDREAALAMLGYKP